MQPVQQNYPIGLSLNDLLESYLCESVAAYSNDEVIAIAHFVNRLSGNPLLNPYPLSANQLLFVRAAFIHKRPFVFFVNPRKICGKVKSELGDILFVLKHFKYGALSDYRGSFSQAKMFRNGWDISSHQFEFLDDIERTTFRFGNRVYKMLGTRSRSWTMSRPAKWFSNYLLLKSQQSLCISTRDLRQFCPNQCQSFKLTPNNFGIAPYFGRYFRPTSSSTSLVPKEESALK